MGVRCVPHHNPQSERNYKTFAVEVLAAKRSGSRSSSRQKRSEKKRSREKENQESMILLDAPDPKRHKGADVYKARVEGFFPRLPFGKAKGHEGKTWIFSEK